MPMMTDRKPTQLTTSYANASLAPMPPVDDGLYNGVRNVADLVGVSRLEAKIEDRFIIEITGGFCE